MTGEVYCKYKNPTQTDRQIPTVSLWFDIQKKNTFGMAIDLVGVTFVFSFLNNCSDAIAKISDIINELGEASARAQGLSKAVTTAQKLRNSDHIVYLLSEPTGRK